MILINKKLEFITPKEIEITAQMPVTVNGEPVRQHIQAVLLDTRFFDVSYYPNLKVVSRVGVGTDNIDLEECKRRNIKVCTTPVPELIDAVVDFNIMQLLRLMAFNELRDSIRGKRIALVGFGRIGQGLFDTLSSAWFSCDILLFDNDSDKWLIPFSMEEFKKSIYEFDIITVHVSGNDEVVGYEDIRRMKKGSYLLNMARGKCVNFVAAIEAVKRGNLAGFATDVNIMQEYMTLVQSPLEHNILITPHIAGKTSAARLAMEYAALNNIVEELEV